MQYEADAAFILPLAHDGPQLALALEPATVAGISTLKRAAVRPCWQHVEVKTAKGACALAYGLREHSSAERDYGTTVSTLQNG